MSRHPSLDDIVLGLLRSEGRGVRLKVGVLLGSGTELAAAIAAEGHYTVIVSERFRPLWRVYRRLGRALPKRTLLVEARALTWPFLRSSLDALVLCTGFPLRQPPFESMVGLRSLLRPGGKLIAPHPLGDGLRGRLCKLASVFWPRAPRPAPRAELCSSAMAAGFCDIGQVAVARGFTVYAVTTAHAQRRTWDASQKQRENALVS